VRYPVGALLVKEKFEKRDDATPAIITVMEKVADAGKVSDWQFYMIRLADRSIVREGFEVSCTDCHSCYPKNDFVSHVTTGLLEARAQKAAAGQPAAKPGAGR
jgi:uncharacterized membrane protein